MSGARPDSWMPLYWGDYHRDTGHLSAAEHGAYLLLLGHYWTTGKPLPADDAQLGRIARMTTQEWRRSRATIAAFFQAKDGTWLHKRVQMELERARINMERRSKAGKKGAETRWQPDSIATGNRIAAAPPSQWQNDGPSPSPSPSSDGGIQALSSNTPNSDKSDSGTAENQNFGLSRIIPRPLHGPDYHDPANRRAYADAKVAEILAQRSNGPDAWLIVLSARDPADPDHAKNRRECEKIARSIAVVWEPARFRSRDDEAPAA